ncbi:1,2-phenylacetyl-CoA epoxidase subunit PaaD [Actinoalloteichus sp. AHMU CJ021]|uniref:1,2-phenylacetyl-CoA epoxidase subunit PaaD n=1 Tax=Actinoalloteichus sp. AHMU CJ021 TaxID=2072503 RepID=UPI00307C79DE
MVTVPSPELDRARAAAGAVVDPELPMLTLVDLGVLRSVEIEPPTRVVVTVTPTYSGCPALVEMRADLVAALHRAGFPDVDIRTALAPPWSSDWITPEGRAALREHGIAPPGPAPRRGTGPVPLRLDPPPAARCPRCDSPDTDQLAAFGATACRALRRCRGCGEPFEQVREL